MSRPDPRLAVLISGRGSNMVSILDAIDAGQLPATAALVVSDKADAAGLSRAAERGVDTAVCARQPGQDAQAWAQRLTTLLEQADIQLVALAGFMRILPPAFCTRWHGALLNIHPSLLPRHKGLDTHQRALDAGDAEAGCSVHFVTAELDGGPVIAQARVAIAPGDDADRLAAKVLQREHVIYPQVLAWCASGRVRLEDTVVQCDGMKLSAPLEV
ncbi:MAG: phosphoribosylglycinamide formyltransferase [Pseudomonadota bacterium]